MSTQQPNGAQPPRQSTSIDDVMSQQGAEVPGSSSAVDQPLPGPLQPPAPSAAPAQGGVWKSAREVNQRTPRKRSFSGDAPMWFGLGLALLLWGGILLVDHFGPTRDLEARITAVDLSRSRKGGTSYSIEGVDSAGGEFDTDVPKSIYQRADRGERVVVSRAWLTGRVVAIDGGGWRHDGGRMVWLHGIAFTVGVVLLIGGLVSMIRFAAADPDNPRPLRRVRWWLIVVGLLAAGWIAYERNDASASNGDSSNAAPTATEATLPPAPGSVECTDLTVTMALVIPALTSRGSVGSLQVDQAVDTVSAVRTECTRASIQTALCRALRQAASVDASLSVITDGRCPGILP